MVCHSRARKGASLKEQEVLDFPNVILKRVYIGKAPTSMIQCVLPTLVKHKPEIVISEFSLKYLTFWLLFVLRFFFGYKLVVWTHGIKSKEILKPFSALRSKIQLWVYNHVDAVVLYSEPIKKLLTDHVKNPESLFVANNTLDTQRLNEVYNQLETIGREQIKKQLGFSNKYNLVFIGRLLKRKRLDLLFEAFAVIDTKFDVGLHIIGDGQEEEVVKIAAEESKNIIYHGPIHELELSSKYLFVSDLMVMPGYVGLSAVHSMAMGCPVVTCKQGVNGPYHGPEAAYIKNDVNGILCDYSSEGLRDAVSKLMNDPEQQERMSVNSRKTIKEKASLEHFVDGFKQTLNYLRK